MWMATESNSGFRHDESLSSMISRHAFNFQSNTCSEMVPIISNAAVSELFQTGNSSKPSLDSSFASEWSIEEQFKLENGLEKYKDKPSIIKYIKIAATLPNKTVRDVALRSRWMTRKRRKAEELNCGKRISSSKAELSSNSSIPSGLPDYMAAYPFSMPFMDSRVVCEDVSGQAINIIEQNVSAFSQIRANLSSQKVEDNVDLFSQTRNNLITIQNHMNNMPGLMSQMPPLPVAINDDLSATLLSNSTLEMPFNTMQRGGGFHMKQEPLG